MLRNTTLQLLLGAALTLGTAACGDDSGGDASGVDGGRVDGGGGVMCGGSTCGAGQVCCIDCDGTGTCSAPGGGCPGYACPMDAGPDSGDGIVCASTTCAGGEVCCIDCDGTGTCGPPGTACVGIACPPPDAGPAPDGNTGGACPTGTCRLTADGACEEPSGPTGNGCCACGADDMCSEFCRCAAPDTPIATPSGDVPIASLREGDLVYSMDRGELVAVPVRMTHRQEVSHHAVVRVELESGAVLQISPMHPTADARTFGDLAPGDDLGGQTVQSVELVPYGYDATYDILPASDSGTYVAAGALIGSTLGTGNYHSTSRNHRAH